MNTEHIELLARVGSISLPVVTLRLYQRTTVSEDLVRAGLLERKVTRGDEYIKATPKGLQFLAAITDALNAHAKAS